MMPKILGSKMTDLGRDREHPLNVSSESTETQNSVQQSMGPSAKAKADILEASNSYMFVLDMPGLEPGNIAVKIKNYTLSIVGRKENGHSRKIRVIKMGRRAMKYKRKFILPGDINIEASTATYRSGVLTVTVRKRKTSQRLRSVTIPVS